MTAEERTYALEKIAYFGPADVVGSPSYTRPPLTVGQMMYRSGGPYSPLTPVQSRELNDSIVRTGIDVNSPAKSLLHAGIGALAGNFISNALGAGPFMRGMATAIGANYGYNYK